MITLPRYLPTDLIQSRFRRLWSRLTWATLYMPPPRRDDMEKRFMTWWQRQLEKK